MPVKVTDSGKWRRNRAKILFAIDQGLIRVAMLAAQDATRTAPVLTGRLKRSIAISKPFSLPGRGRGIYVGTNVVYARIQEFGGRIPPRFIKPVKAKALHWEKDGIHYFSKGHDWPGATIPARPYLRPALERRRRFAKFTMMRAMVKAIT